MNSIFTEENLLAFTMAARYSSFSKAAEELGLTTSAISYTIKRMEMGLDVVLFTRSTRSIELTESGRYLFRKATDLLNDFHAIKRSIDTIAQGIEARVRICINQLLYTPQHTARLLQVLKKQFPTCQITVTTEVYNGVWDSIINNPPISPLARPIHYWTAAELITPRSARSVGLSRLLRIIRWRLCLNPSLRANCACTRTSWWKTPHTPSTKKSAGCYTVKSRFWFPILIPSASARSWGRALVFCQTIWCARRWKSRCW